MEKKLRIVSETVIDRDGNVVGTDPTKFPKLANKCKELALYLETGLEYKVC
ncbi:hypothetical protein ACFQ3W_24960 [Paenibacillus puldeungensis]|uniref:Uncharacterized protein n=1 Tax=Paenibacillus puldeungensis TaxID=696536 RepID=A0ABW3S430_9BACL